jgi:OOP family OmpA-OmpF porin
MKMSKTSTILAAASTLMLATAAHAAVFKDAVHSTNGKTVHSTNGNCVITKWDAKGACADRIANVDYELRTVYFDFNSASLTPAAKTKLNALVAALKSSGAKEVRIVGFADEIGAASYNDKLSKRRAAAVSAYLKRKGVAVNKGKFEVRGLGETESKSECAEVKGKDLKACLWRDRRVEVEIVN